MENFAGSHSGGLIAGTLILMADETEKKIESLKPGEFVLAADDHGDIFRSRITKVFVDEVREYFVLDFGFEKLCAASGQKLLTDGGPREMDELFEGSIIKEYRNGWHERAVKIKSRVKCFRPVKVYGLELAEKRSYFAGRKTVITLQNKKEI